MAPKTENSTLQQKLDRPPVEASGRDRSPLRAIRIALARVSREMVGLRLDVIGGTQTKVQADDVVEYLPKDQLLILLDGPEGNVGGLAMDTTLVSALIQQQTMGSVALALAGNRVFTDTDAALCAPIVAEMLTAAAGLSETVEDRLCLAGFSYGARAEDGQGLALGLRAARFRVFELKLDVEGGAAQADMVVVLPDREVPVEDTGDGDASEPAGSTLQDVALSASVRLNAVLCRLHISLNDLAALKPNDHLMLSGYRLERTELLTTSGQRVGEGRLGRVEGVRAIRVNETSLPNASFALSETRPPPEILNRPEVAKPVIDTTATERVADLAEDEKETLEQLSPDEAMARISELAGLASEDVA